MSFLYLTTAIFNYARSAPRYNADVMAIIGTILNWMTFPTFNAYFAPVACQQVCF
jgi:hypothetical protein